MNPKTLKILTLLPVATISSAIASVAVLSWNFIGYKFFVFKR
jgi:putative flippase GtrA